MGYSFASTASGRQALCCDNCGKTGQVRKRVCPYTVTDDNSRSVDGRRHVLPYCRPPAVCPKCWTTLKAKVHADCKAGAAKAQAKADARQAKLDAGDLIVLAAWGDWDKDTPQGMTRVCFGGPGGRGERMYLMPAGDYKDGGWLSDYPNAVPVDQASAIDGRSSTGEHEYVEEPDGKYSNLVWASCSCGSWRNVGAVNPVVGRHQHGIHLAEVGAARLFTPVREPVAQSGTPEVATPAPAVDGPAEQTRSVLARATWADGNLGTRRSPHIVHVLVLPDGRLERDQYEAVRDVVATLGGVWKKPVRGFAFEPPKLLWDSGPGMYTRSGRENLDEWLGAHKPDTVPNTEPAEPVVDAPAAEVIEVDDTVQIAGQRGHWVVDVISAGLVDISQTRGHERRGGMKVTQTTVSLSRLLLVRKGNDLFDALRAMGIDPRNGADLPVEAGSEPNVASPPVQEDPAVTVTRTRVGIGTQIEEAAATLGLTCSATWRDGGFAYQVDDKVMAPSEAADHLLAGGFKEAFGRERTIVHPDRLAELKHAEADSQADAKAEPDAGGLPAREEPAKAEPNAADVDAAVDALDAVEDEAAEWEARIARLLPFCQQGENYRRAVVEAVHYARMKLETGGDPTLDMVEGEIAAGLRPRSHRALAANGQPVPPIDPSPEADAEALDATPGTPESTAVGADGNLWEERIERLSPFLCPGRNFRLAVAEAVKSARRKLETGGNPHIDVVTGEVAAGWRPKRHIALAVTEQPVPLLEVPEPELVQAAEREPAQVDTPADLAGPQPRRVPGQWAALLAGNEAAG